MGTAVETGRGIVRSNETDAFGELSPFGHAALLDDAQTYLLALAGYSPHLVRDAGWRLATTRFEFSVTRALSAGDPFVVESSFVECSTSRIRVRHRVSAADTGDKIGVAAATVTPVSLDGEFVAEIPNEIIDSSAPYLVSARAGR